MLRRTFLLQVAKKVLLWFSILEDQEKYLSYYNEGKTDFSRNPSAYGTKSAQFTLFP